MLTRSPARSYLEERKQLKARWRELKAGMSTNKAKELVGPPKTVEVTGNETLHVYGGKGYLSFETDKLVGWREPTRLIPNSGTLTRRRAGISVHALACLIDPCIDN
jgi:hypothetical protein